MEQTPVVIVLFAASLIAGSVIAVGQKISGAGAQTKAKSSAGGPRNQPKLVLQSSSSSSSTNHASHLDAKIPVYKPPRRGAPRVRVNAGSRGAHEFPILVAFAPEHLGLTTREQPTLYWHLSRGSSHNLEFTLVTDDETDPLLELTLKGDRRGLGCVALAEHGITLVPGVSYRWSIALVIEPSSRSKDVVSGGMIECVNSSAIGRKGLKGDDPLESATTFAVAGLWYDAIEEILRALAKHPQDVRLIEALNSLLRQARLSEVSIS